MYDLHFEPAYRHTRHYIAWALDVDAGLAEHSAATFPRLAPPRALAQDRPVLPTLLRCQGSGAR